MYLLAKTDPPAIVLVCRRLVGEAFDLSQGSA